MISLLGVNRQRLAVLLLLQVVGVSLFQLDITVEQGFEEAIWQCVAEVPIMECHVAWMDFKRDRHVTVLQVEDGSAGVLNDANSTGVLDYQYSGRGLKYGDCGVKLWLKGYTNWMVGCRVLMHNGRGWKYAWSDFTGTDLPRLQNGMSVEPRMAVVLPGQEATAVCRAHVALRRCMIGNPEMTSGYATINGEREVFSPGYSYYGRGLDDGDCGIKITETWEEDHGLFRCQVEDAISQAFEWRNIPIVVALRPLSVTLETLMVDNMMEARCRVAGGRPLATITWRLDDKLLRQDDVNDLRPGPWIWPWMDGDITQTIRGFTITPEEHGATLSCIVTHPALEEKAVVLQDNLVYSDNPEGRAFNLTVIIDEYLSTSTTEPTTDPDPTTKPSTDPDTTTEPSTDPDTTTEPSTDPDTTTEPSTDPDNHH